ncbi:MAG: hypothetical protein ACRCS9_00210 [Hyphomicrobium sp.]
MQPIPIGFFAKRTSPPPQWLAGLGVTRVCSVSTCIAGGPEGDWLSLWRHNGLTLFDDAATLADILAGEVDPAAFTTFAYRLHRRGYGPDGETSLAADAPALRLAGPMPAPSACPDPFERLGYDCVQTDWQRGVSGFGCSPLSCNLQAQRIAVNADCLIDGLDEAIEAARQFGRKQPEPGIYYVVEVWGESLARSMADGTLDAPLPSR